MTNRSDEGKFIKNNIGFFLLVIVGLVAVALFMLAYLKMKG